MKNIIVPTDFSPCSDNALRYAIGVAKELDAKLHVVYAYNINDSVQSNAIDGNWPKSMERPMPDSEYKKMDLVDNELKNYSGLKYECHIKEGFLDDVLLKLTEKEKVTLIIVGTQGEDEKLSLWTDNNTAKIIEQNKIAVLSVPESFKGKLAPKSEFVMATDFETINNWSAMDAFYELALKLEANINVFYVNEKIQEEDIADYEKAMFAELVIFFKGLNVTMHRSFKSDIVPAIDEFAKTKKASLVMMVTHERGWLEELFHHSITKDMTLNGHIALLTIPDIDKTLNKAYDVAYW